MGRDLWTDGEAVAAGNSTEARHARRFQVKGPSPFLNPIQLHAFDRATQSTASIVHDSSPPTPEPHLIRRAVDPPAILPQAVILESRAMQSAPTDGPVHYGIGDS